MTTRLVPDCLLRLDWLVAVDELRVLSGLERASALREDDPADAEMEDERRRVPARRQRYHLRRYELV